MFIAIGIIGLSGIIAQVIILRELLVSFQGNELTVGIILANWIFAEALGAFICGRYIERFRSKEGIFVFLQLLFAFSLPAMIYFCRVFKAMLGLPPGAGLALQDIFISSLLLNLPIGLAHGALFSVCCSMDKRIEGIARVYIWETIGTIIGGIALTYLLIPYLNSFQIAYGIILANLFVCLVFLRKIASPKVKAAYFFIISACLLVSSGLPADLLQRKSLQRQYENSRVVAWRNSLYGNICLTDSGGQRVFYYNGIPRVTVPYPDMAFVEEYGNLPLLFHPRPRDILVINSAVGGLLNEMLKHPLDSVDYIELDPVFIGMLKAYPAALTAGELGDPRLKVINTDARAFLNNTARQYDLIILGSFRPQDLITNRFFTVEFFNQAKKHLKPEGILAFTLPGSLTYISDQLRDLNFSVINSLRPVYEAVRIIPGDYNLVLGSDSPRLLGVDAAALSLRLAADNIPVKMLQGPYIEYRLDKRWNEWFEESTKGATRRINRDFRPFALFEGLLFWNRQFAPAFSAIFAGLRGLNAALFFAAGLLFFLLIAGGVYIRKRSLRKCAIAFAISSTGFYGMAAGLILIFAFQIRCGYLYQLIGVLISANMAGMACGSILTALKPRRERNEYRIFVWTEAAVIVYALLLTALPGRADMAPVSAKALFTGLIFLAGIFPGLEFPLASRLYGEKEEKPGEISGDLYFVDLAGGWFAGLCAGVVFLPLLGAVNTLALVAGIKSASLLFLSYAAKSGPGAILKKS
ncbi:MAG: hypothetical protein PHH68_01985 [Candidatus Omnitrophica bacterium]|nr:hypothetical protein [Candidatus Omnitrophota bacterium]